MDCTAIVGLVVDLFETNKQTVRERKKAQQIHTMEVPLQHLEITGEQEYTVEVRSLHTLIYNHYITSPMGQRYTCSVHIHYVACAFKQLGKSMLYF